MTSQRWPDIYVGGAAVGGWAVVAVSREGLSGSALVEAGKIVELGGLGGAYKPLGEVNAMMSSQGSAVLMLRVTTEGKVQMYTLGTNQSTNWTRFFGRAVFPLWA